MSSRECKSYETQSSCSQQVPSTIHRLGTDEPLTGEKRLFIVFKCCYTGTEGTSPLTKRKFRPNRKAQKNGFVAEQKWSFLINTS